MRSRDTVTVFVPVDRDGFEIVWRKYVIKNTTLIWEHKDGSGEGFLYIFYDKARFYRGGKRIPPFKLRDGCAVMAGEDGALAEQFVISLPPRRLMRVTAAEHFVRGSLKVDHSRLALR